MATNLCLYIICVSRYDASNVEQLELLSGVGLSFRDDPEDVSTDREEIFDALVDRAALVLFYKATFWPIRRVGSLGVRQ